jgi:hypothetical protein
LSEGLTDKFDFFYLYYVKIHAVEAGLATAVESDNISFVVSPLDQLNKLFKDSEKKMSSFEQLVLYNNTELERIYVRLFKTSSKSEKQI